MYFPLSGDQPNAWLHQSVWFQDRFYSHVRHENTAQHDCFYRNMYVRIEATEREEGREKLQAQNKIHFPAIL